MFRSVSSTIALLVALAGAGGVYGLTAEARQRQALAAGRWDATVRVNGVDVPFRFELEEHGGSLRGTFFDGDLSVRSDDARLQGGQLVLPFPQYGARLEVALVDGRLEGRYDRGTRGAAYPFSAVPAATTPEVPGAPDIAGIWIIPTNSSKGERAFRFIVRQDGARVSATILRVDGDTGTLSGAWTGDHFLLSHFSGARPLRLDVSVAADGTLALLQNGTARSTAVREAAARAASLPEPTDPEHHTRPRDPSAKLALAFPDLDGRVVSLDDARFAGKVVIVSIGGSWCPNCHDEAPFLVELHRTYKGLGLEVVLLSFEEAAQLADPTRVRAFRARYGIEYPVLLAGEPDELNVKVPQFENLNAFPTSFYLGRDGRVRFVHAGFPSPASGPFYLEARQAIVRQVEQLLSEK